MIHHRANMYLEDKMEKTALLIKEKKPEDYQSWKLYHDTMEKDLRESPFLAKYFEVFLEIRSSRRLKDRLVFRVKILDGRISFGKLQFLVMPFEANSVNGPCGCRWVDRDAVVFEHDKKFELYVKATDPTAVRRN